MKIKTKRKLNLPELIQYVWENDIESTGFLSNEELLDGKNVGVHVNPRDVAGGRCAGVAVESGDFVVDDSYTFTVEVEEELTNRTKLPDLVIVYNNNFIITDSDECISEYINDYDNESVSNRMYVPYKGGLKLVWSRKNGIPESGVLEVDQNERKIKRQSL